MSRRWTGVAPGLSGNLWRISSSTDVPLVRPGTVIIPDGLLTTAIHSSS